MLMSAKRDVRSNINEEIFPAFNDRIREAEACSPGYSAGPTVTYIMA